MAAFPSHPDDITPEWLTGRLHEAGVLQRGNVTGFRWEPIGTGQVGDSARISLSYDQAGGGPATVAGKFPAANPTSRGTAAMMGLYTKEVRFYRDLAQQLDVRVPATYAAEVNDDGSSFVLLFEDLAPEKGGNQLDSCSFDEACHAIRQAAALHAPSWKNAAILSLDWLQPQEAVTSQIRALYPQAQAIFAERYADALEPEFMAVCSDLAANDAWLSRNHPKVSLVHGDFRLDNMLFGIGRGAEPIAILDWQTLSLGHPMTDIGYFMGCGIGNELRQRYEAELLLDEARVGSTLVMYGSARIPSPETAQAKVDAAANGTEYEQLVAKRLAEKAMYYDQAYKLARLASEKAIIEDGLRQFVVCSGGGPSIMEAANRGASDAGAESIGLNIVLPHEQAPNSYVTPYLSLNFHYFALRKMHFLLRARAVAVFPGGFGTFDEFFELLTLIQTGKMKPIPILLFGKDFWQRVVNFEAIAEEGTIAKKDLELFKWCEDYEDAWNHIAEFYELTR